MQGLKEKFLASVGDKTLVVQSVIRNYLTELYIYDRHDMTRNSMLRCVAGARLADQGRFSSQEAN